MVKKLYPLDRNLTTEQQELLYCFLKKKTDHFWPKGTIVGNDYILSCNVLKRARENTKGLVGDRYECFDEECDFLDKSISTVFASKGAFHLEVQNSITIADKKSRVLKKFKGTDAKNEYDIAPPHIRKKPPITIEECSKEDPSQKVTVSYLVSRRFQKVNLSDIIESDLRGRGLCQQVPGEPSEKLPLKTRLLLTKAILIAHRTQNVGFQVIHGDIKPANIMVNLEGDPIEVNFIDYEFGMNKTNEHSNVKIQVTTPIYAAPELFFKKPLADVNPSKCDIFSLGRTLFLLWGTADASYEARELEKIFKNTGDIRSLFAGIDLTEDQKNIMREFFYNFLDREPYTRIASVDSAIELLEQFEADLNQAKRCKPC